MNEQLIFMKSATQMFFSSCVSQNLLYAMYYLRQHLVLILY